MPLEKYEIETAYDANGQIIVKVGNPEGDLTYATPQYHHGHPKGTEPEEGGDHITVLVRKTHAPTNQSDLVFKGIEMYQDPSSKYFEVVSVVEINEAGEEKEKKRRKTATHVSSSG